MASTTCAKLGRTTYVGLWALAPTALIDVSQAVVDVGIALEPIARFGRTPQAIVQPFSLVGGQTVEPCASQA